MKFPRLVSHFWRENKVIKGSGGPPNSWGFWDVVAFQARQWEAFQLQKEKGRMTTCRRQEILSVILDQLETAGPAGFASMCHFGMIRRKRSGGMTIRRAASVYNILEAIAGCEDRVAIEIARAELAEFTAEVDELTLARIKDAGDVWWDRMNAFWLRESARIFAELAERTACMNVERAAELAAK